MLRISIQHLVKIVYGYPSSRHLSILKYQSQLIVSNRHTFACKLLVNHLLHGFLGLSKSDQPGFSLVVRVGAKHLELGPKLLFVASNQHRQFLCLWRIKPLSVCSRVIHLYNNKSSERLVPFSWVDHLILALIDCIEEVFDHCVAWSLLLAQLHQSSDKLVKVEQRHSAGS